MKALIKPTALTALLLTALTLSFADGHKNENKDFVVNAITELFIDGDITAIDRYWATHYKQRNPSFPSGTAVIKELFSNMPPNFKYEMGMVIAENDLVVIHRRYTGFALKPLIAVDIFRIENGLIAEHWDILQEEVLDTASGLPMFEAM